MGSSKLWQLPVVGRLGVQHGLVVGWFLLVGVLAVLLLPGPAGSATAPGSLVEAQTVDIGMQFQSSPVAAPISNVHVSNGGDNNSTNSIIGNSDLIINGNVGASASAFPAVDASAAAPVLPATVDAPGGGALPAADVGAASSPSLNIGDQSHCGVVAGIGASGGGSGSGDTRCTSVESGGDSQVNTDGFGDIGMQFQQSPVNAPITNVHISNEGNNNSNNTIVGDNNVIINANLGITINV